MLNDLALPTRLLLALYGGGFGLMIGSVLTYDPPEDGTAVLVLLPLGGAVFMVASIGWTVFLRRAERRFRDELTASAGALAAGTVVGVPAPGRVVRRRIDRRRGWVLPGRGVGPGPSVVLVLTALADEGPRRVAALVPADLGLEMRHAPAALLLHPTHPEVAVVDDRITVDQLAAVRDNPRWTTERLPTDRTVAGGYLAMLASVLGGAVAGAVVATLGLALT